MFSFSIAYFIGHYFDNTAIGFAAVGGIAIVVFLIYITFIKKNIENKVKDAIVKAALKAALKAEKEKND